MNNTVGKLRNMSSIYLLRGEEILLLYRQCGRVINNVWTGSAGGHFEESELNDAKACILREMQEEIGLCEQDLQNFSMKYITLRKLRGEIRQNYFFFANVNDVVSKGLVSNEGKLKWFPLTEISDLKMPYTARYVIDHYISTGQYNEKLYAGIANAREVSFFELEEF